MERHALRLALLVLMAATSAECSGGSEASGDTTADVGRDGTHDADAAEPLPDVIERAPEAPPDGIPPDADEPEPEALVEPDHVEVIDEESDEGEAVECEPGACPCGDDADCPAGWLCEQIESQPPDPVYLCLSPEAILCRPCVANEDCEAYPVPKAPCLAFGAFQGSFCGAPCGAEDSCLSGYHCADATTIEGENVRQCLPDGGECGCSLDLVDLGLSTYCSFTNDWGTCHGVRTCEAGGLTACDAATPALEQCNGQDDDCDGTTDDGGDALCLPGESCQGADGCVCVPNCADKQCGDDGCGASCGTCDGVMACQAGECVCAGVLGLSGPPGLYASYDTAMNPSSVAVGELNGDGKPDLAVAGYDEGTVSVLLNNGDGTFAPRVDFGMGMQPTSVAVGDLNGDGDSDLVVTGSVEDIETGVAEGFVRVRLNAGNGTFEPGLSYSTGRTPVSAAIRDVNGDGSPDLAIANREDGTVSLLLNNGDGTFAPKIDYIAGRWPKSVVINDLSGDGSPDVVVVNGGLTDFPAPENTVSVLLNHGDGTFATPVDYAVGEAPWSVAIDDFNGDAKPDLAVSNLSSNTVSVLLNVGDGTFGAKADHETGSSPTTIAAGDLNGDGRPDLAVATSGQVSVLLNSGNGNFVAGGGYGAGNPSSIVIANLNGDATLDLVVANVGNIMSGRAVVTVMLNRGDAVFATKVDYALGASPSSVVIGDLNGDGKPDLAIASYYENAARVLLNNGDGTYAASVGYATGVHPESVGVGDLNGDGAPDLAAANHDDATVSVLFNNGDGTFTPNVDYGVGTYPYFVAVGDVNGDGKPDLAVANYFSTSTVSLLLNNGDGTFATKVDYTASGPSSVSMGDLDGDARPELVTTYPGGSRVSVLRNNGDGTFAAKVDYFTGNGPRHLAIGDLDGDGSADLAVANNYDDTVSVLYNNGDGTFADRKNFNVGIAPESIAIGDLNGDGRPDLTVANGSGGTIGVLVNAGARTFAAMAEYGAGGGPSSVAVGDLNTDGRPDVVVANSGSETISVLMNTCAAP